MSTDISYRIKRVIEKSGLSFKELEARTGIPKSAIQRYASGDTNKLPVDRLKKIADATHVSPAYLMGWSDKLLEYVAEDDKEFVKDVLENGVVDHTVRLDEKEEALQTLLNDFGFDITKFDDGDYMLSGSGATRITKKEFERLLNSTIEYLEFNTKKLYDEKMYDADGCTTIGKK